MRKLTKVEKKAAMAVIAMAAATAGAGIALLKKHTKYILQKAASTFKPEDEIEDETIDETVDGTVGSDNGDDTFVPKDNESDDPFTVE